MMISRGRSSGSGIFIGQAETSSIIIVDMGGIFPGRGARRRKLGRYTTCVMRLREMRGKPPKIMLHYFFVTLVTR